MIHLNRIKNVLIGHDLMKEAAFEKYAADARQKEISFEEYLVQLKAINEETLFEYLAKDFNIPFVNLSGKKIKDGVLLRVPEAIAQAHQIIAFDQSDSELHVAMLDPDDLQTLDFISKKTHLKLKVFLTSHKSLRDGLKLYQKNLNEELNFESEPTVINPDHQNERDPEKLASDLPVIRIAESILKSAVYESASDIHIEPTEDDVIVRYRVDGLLRKVMTLPKQIQAGIVARIKVLANLKLDEHRLPQDGRFKMKTDQFDLTTRVSIIPVIEGEKIVIRLLDESPKLLTFEQLGLSVHALNIVKRNIKKPHGIILATGPTGSGKTTTLYTILNQLNTPEVNISTIEDPIEYRLKGINQSQINPKMGFSFANGLRSLLRQDPNIIMVGEIRDTETGMICAQAAMTGHLVLSTLHTNDAVTALPRLKDMGVELFMIASTINMIIAQRLVRKICDHCIESVTLAKKQIETIEETLHIPSLKNRLKEIGAFEDDDGDLTELSFFRGKGCEECGGDGSKGRIGIFEVLEVTKEIAFAITNRQSVEELLTLAKKQGMFTMVDDGLLKARQGLTTIEEILRVTKD